MGDADQAQYNALNAVFGTHAQFKCLMCFFHVMKKVHEALRCVPVGLCAKAIEDIYDLHFATNEAEIAWMRENVLQSWSGQPLLKRFAAYMKAQWLYGRFSNWQVFSTASGFATTNNPVETFNSVLKRDYTMRRRLTMGTLLRELSDCCHCDSGNLRPFLYTIIPSAALVRRAKEMARGNLLQVWNLPSAMSITPQGWFVVNVLSWPASRVQVGPTKRSEIGMSVSAQMGSNYARMEVLNQPLTGSPVDLQARWCPCKFWFAFGTCVHVIHALHVTGRVDCEGRQVLVSRKRKQLVQSQRPLVDLSSLDPLTS